MFFFLKKAYIERTLKRNALRKGLLGGSPLWRAVWAGQLLLKGWGKISKGGEAPITFDESIGEGEAWAIVHEPEQSRKGRGEGRTLLIGPKRTAPRANVMTGTALGTIGKRILEAPSAERINEILGANVVEEPPPSRSQRRAARKADRARAKSDHRTEKRDVKTAKAAAKTAQADAKAAAKTAKSDAKAAAKSDAKAAKADAKSAAKTAKAAAKTAQADAKTAKSDAKAAAKTAKSDAKAAAKSANSDAKAQDEVDS